MTLYPVSKLKASALVRSFIVLFASLTLLSACTTTPQRPYPGPTGPTQGQPQPESPIPSGETPEGNGEETPSTTGPETETPPNSNAGLTPPFMVGQDIKRIALLLPFSAKSERLRAEAQ